MKWAGCSTHQAPAGSVSGQLQQCDRKPATGGSCTSAILIPELTELTLHPWPCLQASSVCQAAVLPLPGSPHSTAALPESRLAARAAMHSRCAGTACEHEYVSLQVYFFAKLQHL